MDAEKVKEKIKQRIEKHKRFMADANREELWGIYEYALHMLQNMKREIAGMEAAEQEASKGLPYCSSQTPETGCKGDYRFCKHMRFEPDEGRPHCGYPFDEPTEAPEPKAYYKDLFEFWKKQAEIYMRETIHLKKRAQKEPEAFNEISVLEMLQKRLYKEINHRVDKLEGISKYGHEETEEMFNQKFEAVEKHLRLHNKKIGTIAIGLDLLRETDTAFSDKLQGYLERLDKQDIKIDGVIEDLESNVQDLYKHIADTRRDIERKQADEQLEEAERERQQDDG